MIHKTATIIAFLVFLLASSNAAAQEDKQSQIRKGEVVVIGKTDLPRVNFSIPWQLPKVQKRSEQDPPIRRTNELLRPTEPERRAEQVQFIETYKVDLSNLSVR